MLSNKLHKNCLLHGGIKEKEKQLWKKTVSTISLFQLESRKNQLDRASLQILIPDDAFKQIF